MSTIQQSIILNEEAFKIFIFEQVNGFEAAEQKAEEKKLNAFGMMAKLNILNRPKASTVKLIRKECRYEPLWHVEANKVVEYDHHSTYEVHVPNKYVQSIEIEGRSYQVARNDDEASVSLSALEKCYRKIYYNASVDGLNRYIYPDTLLKYSEKFKLKEVKEIDASLNMVQPLLSQIAVIKQACQVLNKEEIKAHEVHKDLITFDKVHLVLVPVFAFEYDWESGGKTGVIEINGLTGEVKEDGQWYKEKLTELYTGETLIKNSTHLDSELISKDIDSNEENKK